MKRPQQHIIETKSKKSFERLIPDTWVARELGSDYGLDYLLEIFKNNNSSGHLFFVQLKGTDTEIIDDTISYRLSVDNIEYWNTITIPVLLVFYSTKSNKFWGLWINKLKNNFLLKKEDQKKLTIKLSANNLLKQSFFTELETIFEDALPSKINVSYQGNSTETKLLHQCLEKWLKYYFKDEVQFENHMLPNICVVEYTRAVPDSLTIQITTKGKTHILQPVKLSGSESFLFLPDIEIGKIPKPLSECLLLFALFNCEKNIKEAIKIIQATIVDYDGHYLPMESILLLTKTAIKYEKISEINELAKSMVQSNRIEEFQYLNISILFLNQDKSLYDLYQSNLKFAIERIADSHLKGIFSYNLANSFRSRGDYYLSSLNYQIARRYEPMYKERFYWWFEYAGVLFLLKHYTIAEVFYLKSYELDNTKNIPQIFGLIGDCKFFQGKFSDSIEHFEKLVNQLTKQTIFADEFILKYIMVKKLVALKLDSLNIDIAQSEKLTLKGIEKKDEGLFFEAIKKNPLNGLAWFNYAILLNLKGDLEPALTAFLMTACIQPWDIEAWIESLGIAFYEGHNEMFTIIFGAAYENIGEKFVNHFSQSILDQTNITMETKQKLIIAVTEISNAYIINRKN